MTPVGKSTTLYVYTSLALAEGDVLTTTTERTYRILSASQGRIRRDRWTCQVMVIEPTDLTAEDTILFITWHKR